ncbi:MAG: UDP-N-acetylglucosamine 1-carboxyvinyltransferase [Candidatus Gracilibacteria bacterium]|nr:UDP-N-acetylglucosamine 1-carboxyvinyltransferase [Candidatus Gracilibacteria bacterium]MDD2908314.1 UDP-N-acetylglucosamine 1-carboxyvinyltransferase [Candidatus Gracilibacteria bacterium]
MLKVAGGQKIKGSVQISGSKNASLPIIAASLLIKKVTLNNVPRIGDVLTFLDIIESLGVKVDFQGNTLKMDSSEMNLDKFNKELINKIRVGIFLLPPILQKFGEINIPFPGGCNIGKRPIDEHIKGLVKLGYKNIDGMDKVHLSGKMDSGEKEIIIDWFSVTATENLIIASVLRPGKTILRLGAIEPHVINLIKFFNNAGAKITLDYDHSIIIDGVENLADEVEFSVCSDYIEAGTFMVLGALASDNYIDIKNACILDSKSFLAKLEEAGVKFEQIGNDELRVYNSIENLKAVRFQTKVFPGLPTDLQSPLCVLLTQADGISKVEEVIYEGRLNFLVEIEKMKGHPAILNPHEALIFGKTKLKGATVSSWDLRAGVAMIIAGLIATGDTYITNVEYIERGYEDIIGKMRKLGAVIEKVNSEEK